MKLATKEDIEASVEQVFAELIDFDAFERAAIRRGADVVRMDSLAVPEVGNSWRAAFDFRGKRRKITVRLSRIDRPGLLEFEGGSSALEAGMVIELLALSPRRTRMHVRLEVKGKTLATRIFLQSLRLAKARVTDRFSRRVRGFVITLEDKLSKPTLG